MSEIDKNTQDYLKHVISSFSPGLRYACAYGSGVFKQKGHKSIKDNMIDFIFVVNDAFSWHYQTLERYSNHYSFVKTFGPRAISNIQKNYGAGVFFNTVVEFDDRLIKYGVIELDAFLEDLLEWRNLYIAGRLHKPVYTLKGLEDPSINVPFKENLRSAVKTSLLTLPEEFDLNELYMRIASLSYTGDLRMVIGEDKGKIGNIVSSNMDGFTQLYQSILCEDKNVTLQGSKVFQDIEPFVQCDYALNLPKNLKRKLCQELNIPSKHNPVLFENKFIEMLRNRKHLNIAVMKSVSKIVRRSSTSQTIKNSVSAGFSKSIFYSAEKLRKMLRGFR